MSISYEESEPLLGLADNAYINELYQQAVTEGVSVFVAAGDDGAASSDPFTSVAVHGIAVSGLASTPYDVAVGGTDFGDTFAGTHHNLLELVERLQLRLRKILRAGDPLELFLRQYVDCHATSSAPPK